LNERAGLLRQTSLFSFYVSGQSVMLHAFANLSLLTLIAKVLQRLFEINGVVPCHHFLNPREFTSSDGSVNFLIYRITLDAHLQAKLI
jgi:hypothetical protein